MTRTVYEPMPMDGTELCQPVDPAEFDTLHALIDGKSRRQEWRPIAMKVIKRDRGKALAFSDAPHWMSYALVLRPEAVEKLEPMLSKNGELLPVGGSAAGLSLYNPTKVIDVLDRKRAEVWTFDDGSVMNVVKYAFRPGELSDVDVFKIPDFRLSPVFVTDVFVGLWRAAGLKGLEFKKLGTA
jgi:hypothetical protein